MTADSTPPTDPASGSGPAPPGETDDDEIRIEPEEPSEGGAAGGPVRGTYVSFSARVVDPDAEFCELRDLLGDPFPPAPIRSGPSLGPGPGERRRTHMEDWGSAADDSSRRRPSLLERTRSEGTASTGLRQQREDAIADLREAQEAVELARRATSMAEQGWSRLVTAHAEAGLPPPVRPDDLPLPESRPRVTIKRTVQEATGGRPAEDDDKPEGGMSSDAAKFIEGLTFGLVKPR